MPARCWRRPARTTMRRGAPTRSRARPAPRAAQLGAPARGAGYEVRRARPDGATALAAAVAAGFGGAWPWEIERALGFDPPGVHVAVQSGDYAAFAVHDGNNQGLGWFGPAG